MAISYFITGFNQRDPNARLSEVQRLELTESISGMPVLARCEIGVPAEVRTYHGDAPVPALALRLDFADLPALEAQLSEGGRLQRLAASTLWMDLPLDRVSRQARLRRCFLERGGGAAGCDYLVHYPGQAEDLNTRLRYDLTRHAPVMTGYPRVCGVDVFTRIDCCDAMLWQRVNYMQRNRIAFESPQDLLAALVSPVRHRMRQDHARFPAYSEGSRHYPMRVTRWAGARASSEAGLIPAAA